MKEFNQATIRRELKIDAHALGIPVGSAEIFIDRSIRAASRSLSRKSLATEDDIRRAIVKELKKYHADLAYVYENRDKII